MATGHTMNKTVTLLFCSFSALLLSACDGQNTEPFAVGGSLTGNGSFSNNTTSAKNFALVFDDLNPQVYETATGITNSGIEVQITANAGDRYQAKVTGGTVFFRTEIGLLDNNSCELIDGSCTVTWVSNIIPGTVPSIPAGGTVTDSINTVTAWMAGEEGFTDINGSGVFDDGDVFTHDVSDPFLDLTHDGNNPAYNLNDDATIFNRAFIQTDSKYSGTGCSHSTLCATTTSITVFDTQEMNLAF